MILLIPSSKISCDVEKQILICPSAPFPNHLSDPGTMATFPCVRTCWANVSPDIPFSIFGNSTKVASGRLGVTISERLNNLKARSRLFCKWARNSLYHGFAFSRATLPAICDKVETPSIVELKLDFSVKFSLLSEKRGRQSRKTDSLQFHQTALLEQVFTS